jgi:hypothetical protein
LFFECHPSGAPLSLLFGEFGSKGVMNLETGTIVYKSLCGCDLFYQYQVHPERPYVAVMIAPGHEVQCFDEKTPFV